MLLPRRFPLPFSAAALAVCAAAASAQTPVGGPRGAAMGGASVAVADEGTAVWTNPAGLARDERLDLQLFGGAVATSRNDFLGTADRLSSLNIGRIGAGQDLSRIPGAVADIMRLAQPGTGVVGSGAAGLVLGRSGIAIGIGEVAYSAVYPTIDLAHVLPIVPTSPDDLSFAHNKTGVSFAGLEAREARLAYATSFFAKTLLVGGTVRYIQGRTYFLKRLIFDSSVSDPVAISRKAFEENRRDSTKLAFDAGAMVNLAGKVRIGVVATGINQPEFAVANDVANPSLLGAPKVYRLPRTLRAGVAVTPIGLLLVAVDYDVKETDTLLPGGRSRQLAGGVELKLPLFAIRAGAFRDSAAPDPHWAYSAGIGLGLKMLSVNAALVFSTEGGTSLSSTNRRDLGGALDARFRF